MLQKLFGFDSAQHRLRTEVYAGMGLWLRVHG